jgi:integrase-like protein
MKALAAEGIAPLRFHDLRHTPVAWLVAGVAPLPHIQARLGHESITTTIDTYGHLLSAGDELISAIIDTALSGGSIRPNTAVWTCCWCAARRGGEMRTLQSPCQEGLHRRRIDGAVPRRATHANPQLVINERASTVPRPSIAPVDEMVWAGEANGCGRSRPG